MKHKHAEVIKAWADGAIIEEYRSNLDQWVVPMPYPIWDSRFTYRIKPEEKIPKEYYSENTFDKKYLYVYNDTVTGVTYMSPTLIHETYGRKIYMGKVEVINE